MKHYESFQKKNKLQELWLKLNDVKAYKQYKFILKEYRKAVKLNKFVNDGHALDINKIIEIADKTTSLNFIHSGNAGDIVYALPTIKKIWQLVQKPVNLYLKLEQPHNLALHFKHPLGSVMLNERMAQMLLPLLSSQTYINICEIYSDQRIDIDLDQIRRAGLMLDRGSIARWYGYIFGINADLYKSWLEVKPNLNYSDTIIIARSQRYRSPFVDYSFLRNYSNLVFVGVKAEFEEMKLEIPNIRYFEATDFLQLAEIIAGCKFFIGNQSFPFSIAEGLKVPRILETFFDTPNVIPEGENSYDFYFQEHFETLVKLISTKSK
ncbi:hypothetical protein [Mucilaginibacter arboris]|uniref:Uncharacterized protein n=1 Tax=Mucilaginibacter arboris TaxID=2682090 RepID=A0A7K1SVH8_9SPHI|nr:hypothetical protein [Mucilaginibacter arboris]MVN21293.1 hypothetical protein [Mucilaginibacter arboris]